MYPYLAPSLAFFVPGSVVYQIVFGGGCHIQTSFLSASRKQARAALFDQHDACARVPSIMYFLRLATAVRSFFRAHANWRSRSSSPRRRRRWREANKIHMGYHLSSLNLFLILDSMCQIPISCLARLRFNRAVFSFKVS